MKIVDSAPKPIIRLDWSFPGGKKPCSALALQVANALQHEQQGSDAFTGISTPLPCFFGRPDWTKVLTKIALENSTGGEVGVFVCGPGSLSAGVSSACAVFNSNSSDVINPGATRFAFHTEVF